MSSEVETSVEFEVRDNGVQANLTLPADDAKVLRQLLASHAGILEGDLGVFEGVLATALSKDLAKVKKPKRSKIMTKRAAKTLFDFFKENNGELDVQLYHDHETEEVADILVINDEGEAVLSVDKDGNLGARVLVGTCTASSVSIE